MQRNRESARNSRERKKIYIKLLENKVEELSANIENQNVALQKKNENFNQLLSSMKYVIIIF